jgi:hypothetical protein
MRTRLLGLALALASTGCIVDIEHTDNPENAFAAARKEAAASQGPGKASEVHVLVYEPRESQLVRVNVPFWLARKLAKDDEDGVPDSAKRTVRLLALQEAGKGTVVEVEEDNGEQVLVWLR